MNHFVCDRQEVRQRSKHNAWRRLGESKAVLMLVKHHTMKMYGTVVVSSTHS
jgi:hypothetical protein